MQGAHTLAQCPRDQGLEAAFAGRSNSGKSSVLNAITGNQKLARISKTPGRTQQLNFFAVTETARLVDLPGYGFARVPDRTRLHWAEVLEAYFNTRQSLAGLFLITDVRHPLTAQDQEMIHWCMAAALPVHVLLNKADKISHGESSRALNTFKRQFNALGVSAQLFSALKNTGVEEARHKLGQWLELV